MTKVVHGVFRWLRRSRSWVGFYGTSRWAFARIYRDPDRRVVLEPSATLTGKLWRLPPSVKKAMRWAEVGHIDRLRAYYNPPAPPSIRCFVGADGEVFHGLVPPRTPPVWILPALVGRGFFIESDVRPTATDVNHRRFTLRQFNEAMNDVRIGPLETRTVRIYVEDGAPPDRAMEAARAELRGFPACSTVLSDVPVSYQEAQRLSDAVMDPARGQYTVKGRRRCRVCMEHEYKPYVTVTGIDFAFPPSP